jgi:hypothetical protein
VQVAVPAKLRTYPDVGSGSKGEVRPRILDCEERTFTEAEVFVML